MKKILPIIVILFFIIGIFYFYQERASRSEFNCVGAQETQFDCYRVYYSRMVSGTDLSKVFADIKMRYQDSDYVSSQCHQLVHVIGFEAAKKFADVSKAYKNGDNFCSSGYYHGVLEGIVNKIGYQNLESKLNDICTSVASERRYSLTHHNCTHGLGHGFMAITDSDLFESIKLCDILVDPWEQSSCHGGVFMENIMFDIRYHRSDYLKPSDPLYPCNAVDPRYRDPCYLIQTSYMLKVTGNDWSKVFELCSTSGENAATCYQSLGRDASGFNLANTERLKNICMLGKNFDQQSNCIVGGAKDVVWYRYSDVEGKELCASLRPDLQPICYSTVESYYQSL